jgi:hypothetical protein
MGGSNVRAECSRAARALLADREKNFEPNAARSAALFFLIDRSRDLSRAACESIGMAARRSAGMRLALLADKWLQPQVRGRLFFRPAAVFLSG